MAGAAAAAAAAAVARAPALGGRRRRLRAVLVAVAAALAWAACGVQAQEAWPACAIVGGVVGVNDPAACCLGMCGSCGGSGCSARPGGAASCCESPILSGSAECLATLAPPCKYIPPPEPEPAPEPEPEPAALVPEYFFVSGGGLGNVTAGVPQVDRTARTQPNR